MKKIQIGIPLLISLVGYPFLGIAAIVYGLICFISIFILRISFVDNFNRSNITTLISVWMAFGLSVFLLFQNISQRIAIEGTSQNKIPLDFQCISIFFGSLWMASVTIGIITFILKFVGNTRESVRKK